MDRVWGGTVEYWRKQGGFVGTSVSLALRKIAVRRWGARGQDAGVEKQCCVEVTSKELDDGC